MGKNVSKSEIREKRVLDFIKDEIRAKGYPPTVREICDALNVKSTSTIHKDISNLIDKGALRKDPSKPRALAVVNHEENDYTTTCDASIISEGRDDVIDIPVVGHIAAGAPILASQNFEDFIPVPSRYVHGENFMLRVRGESMINVGIMDGDLILVERAETAYNGDIVVAMIDGFESEATVKTFYREDGHFRLQPENDDMSPIIVNDVKILGLVKGVFRFFN
ncbi:MAG: transcriptional repressor LexA [Clostridiales bacterium]|nr:transcriptional repressor LexA [Clostridiales bacterium]MDD7348004.1 transcriptional repressor LexA [Clostridiales bacterium]MDY4060565.1 transcriptional repressor LexA [Anaerovoracaceae bacterium]